MLRISSSEALKCFDEKSHVQEIRERAPVLAAMVEEASVTTTKYKHDKSQNIGVDVQCAQSMAVSTLLRSRCLAMSTQAYRVALLLWNSGAKKQVSFSVSKSSSNILCMSQCKPLPPLPHPEPGWGFDFDLVLIFANAPHPGYYQRF